MVHRLMVDTRQKISSSTVVQWPRAWQDSEKKNYMYYVESSYHADLHLTRAQCPIATGCLKCSPTSVFESQQMTRTKRTLEFLTIPGCTRSGSSCQLTMPQTLTTGFPKCVCQNYFMWMPDNAAENNRKAMSEHVTIQQSTVRDNQSAAIFIPWKHQAQDESRQRCHKE